MLRRRGFSLAELLVALLLVSIVLAAATGSLLRQQRTHADLRWLSNAGAQLRSALLTVSGHLSAINTEAGDLTAGQAEDSAMQFRALVAQSVACAHGIGATSLTPDAPGQIPIGGTASVPRAGDSLWWLADSTWLARTIRSVTSVSGSCSSPPVVGATLRLDLMGTDTIPAGTPVRVTRQARYGIYRASDGTWQLGYREWNDPLQQFAAPQPVAGPLLRSAGSRRSGFRYFDSAGTELLAAGGPIDVSRVARMRVEALALAPITQAGRDSVRADSVDIAVRVHFR